jgi:hypothetical protein
MRWIICSTKYDSVHGVFVVVMLLIARRRVRCRLR